MRLDLDTIVLHLMPPHWHKDKWRLSLLSTLLSPIADIFNRLLSLNNDCKSNVNLTSQVMVLENYLRVKLTAPNLYFADTSQDGQFIIHTMGLIATKRAMIPMLIKPYLMAGITYIIQ